MVSPEFDLRTEDVRIPSIMSRSVVLATFAALVASTSAFMPLSGPVYGSLARPQAVAMRPSGVAPVARSVRAPMALRMQSEDDKAKAAGVAAALIGLVVSGFSPLIAVLFGGAAVYAGASQFSCILCLKIPGPNALLARQRIRGSCLAPGHSLVWICSRNRLVLLLQPEKLLYRVATEGHTCESSL